MKHTDYARMIMADYNFLTYQDTDEVLYYKDGIYNLQGEVLIKEEAERASRTARRTTGRRSSTRYGQ